MRTHTPRGILAAIVIASALVVAACGGDDGSDEVSADTEQTTTTAASSAATTPGNPDTSLPTAEEICTKVPTDVVSSTLGLEVTKAEPSDPLADKPPTCTYSFIDAEEEPATLTVAVLRPLDMGGRTGAKGYEATVGFLEAYKDEKGFESVPVDVGRQSVRLTAPDSHAMFSDTGKHVVQMLVPSAGVSGEEADALLAAVVGAVG